MTITSTRYIATSSATNQSDIRFSPKPSPRIWSATEPPFKSYQAPPTDGYVQSSRNTAIVIDNGNAPALYSFYSTGLWSLGASLLRAGWSFDQRPRVAFPATVARYRDRKINRTVSYVGYNAFADATTRGQIRNAFEQGSSIVGNWDVMEGLLDYTFVSLGIAAEDGGVGRPIVMTEPVANLGYSRKSES